MKSYNIIKSRVPENTNQQSDDVLMQQFNIKSKTINTYIAIILIEYILMYVLTIIINIIIERYIAAIISSILFALIFCIIWLIIRNKKTVPYAMCTNRALHIIYHTLYNIIIIIVLLLFSIYLIYCDILTKDINQLVLKIHEKSDECNKSHNNNKELLDKKIELEDVISEKYTPRIFCIFIILLITKLILDIIVYCVYRKRVNEAIGINNNEQDVKNNENKDITEDKEDNNTISNNENHINNHNTQENA